MATLGATPANAVATQLATDLSNSILTLTGTGVSCIAIADADFTSSGNVATVAGLPINGTVTGTSGSLTSFALTAQAGGANRITGTVGPTGDMVVNPNSATNGQLFTTTGFSITVITTL